MTNWATGWKASWSVPDRDHPRHELLKQASLQLKRRLSEVATEIDEQFPELSIADANDCEEPY